MGYLKCKSCGGRYDLEHEESPDDFECCQCGGKLDFYDDQGYKRMYRSVSGKKSNSGMHPLLKILIIIVGGYLIFSFILVPVMALILYTPLYLGPSAGNYIFPILFGICIAAIIGLLWFGFKRR